MNKEYKIFNELLGKYVSLLKEQGQIDEATSLEEMLQEPSDHFVQVVPVKEQADPSVSTE